MNIIIKCKEYLFGKIDLGDDNISRLLINLTIPSILAVFVNNLYQVIDSMFVGKVIGELAIGAVAIVTPFIGIIMTFAMLVSTGGVNVLSRSLGEKDIERAKYCYGNSLTIIVSISIAISIISLIFLEPILGILGAKDELLLLGKEYFGIFLIGIPFMATAFIFGHLLRAEGKSKESMIILVIGSITNIILDYIFMIVFKWGIQGAALATTIANFLSFIYGIIKILKVSSVLKIKWEYFKLDFKLVKEILSIGISSFISQSVSNLGLLVANKVMINVGGIELMPAVGLFGMIQNLVFMPVSGVTQAMQPILGYNYGDKRIDKVLKAVKLTLKYVFFIVLFTSVMAMIFTKEIAWLFLEGDASILEYAVPNIRIALIFSAIGALQGVGGTAFRAIGMAKKSYLFSLLRMVIIFIPSIIILGNILGPMGCWLSYAFADLISGIVSRKYLIKSINKLNLNY
ncbi:MATE family efflux transporter [Clostridium sartagoforme]|uniref:Multidrug export protein MepA n=1 Tax=Clostridium sartagoforme TaxID=84031 RepID=A0A4S2DJL2_9CLOT|nr:MATE family efflux transporter [Clostridium sartagoforme]TGY41832.1 MATE family efflux transporter [Clostridium sartagoforme]